MSDYYDVSVVRTKAFLSWFCPVLAWLSQVLAVLSGLMREGLPILLVLMLVQIVLLVAGLYLGWNVLSFGRTRLRVGMWWSAIIGVALSSGTIILVMIVALKVLM